MNEQTETTENDNVIRLFLCEVEQVFLKPDRLYKFVVGGDCEKCARLAAHAKGERP